MLAVSPGYTPTEFQTVAKSDGPRPLGGTTTPEEVADTALDAIGGGPTVIPGVMNELLVAASRFTPRRVALDMALRMNRKQR